MGKGPLNKHSSYITHFDFSEVNYYINYFRIQLLCIVIVELMNYCFGI